MGRGHTQIASALSESARPVLWRYALDEVVDVLRYVDDADVARADVGSILDRVAAAQPLDGRYAGG